MTDLHDFEARLRHDMSLTAQTFSPPPGAMDRAIDTARARPHRGPLASTPIGRALLPLAAAAVLIIASVVTLLVHSSGLRGAPSGPSRTPSPAPSSSGRTPIGDDVHAATCRVADPTPFADAFRAVLTTTPTGGYDLAGLPILAMTPDGDVLAGPSGPPSDPSRLDLVRPDGSRTTLYRASDVPVGADDTAVISSAQGDTRWIVFAVSVGPSERTVARLGVVNRASGTVTTFRILPAHSPLIILPPVVFGDEVFWAEVDNSGAGKVLRYDPATGHTTKVDSGSALGTPTVIGGGLYWQRSGQLVAYHAGRVPAGYPLGAGRFPTLVSDGTTSVWATTMGHAGAARIRLELLRPGMTAPVAIEDVSADGVLIPLAVAGPFVIWDNGSQLLALDTRTGATGQLGESYPGISAAAAAGDVLALDQVGSKGGPQLSLARIADLPELRC